MTINSISSSLPKRRLDDVQMNTSSRESNVLDSQYSKRQRPSSPQTSNPGIWNEMFRLGDNVQDMNSLVKSLKDMAHVIFQNWNDSQSAKNTMLEGLHCCITETPTKTDVYTALVVVSSSLSSEPADTRKSFLNSLFEHLCVKINEHWNNNQWIQFELGISFLTKACVYGLYPLQLWTQNVADPLLSYCPENLQFKLVSIYLHYCLLSQLPILVTIDQENTLAPLLKRLEPIISSHIHLSNLYHFKREDDLVKLSTMLSPVHHQLTWKIVLDEKQSYEHLHLLHYFFNYSSFYMNDNDQLSFHFPKRNSFTRFYIRNMIRQSFVLSSHNHKACMEYLLNPSSFHHRYLDIASWSRCITEVLFTEILNTPDHDTDVVCVPVVYYHVLMMDALTISTNFIARQIGEAVDTLFYNLDDLTIIQSSRFSQWFAHHLSNFGFKWKWEAWQKHIDSLDNDRASTLFLSQLFQKMIRLSYYDRIKEVIPAYFQSYFTSPSFCFPFLGDDNIIQSPLLKSLSNAIKARETPAAIEAILVPGQSSEAQKLWSKHHERSDDNPIKYLMYALLYNGSKSFTHFSTILERYLEVLKKMTGNDSDRMSIITVLTEFWKDNDIFIEFIIGKLVNLQILNPTNVLKYYLYLLESRPGYVWSQTDWSVVRKQCILVEHYKIVIHSLALLFKREQRDDALAKCIFEYFNDLVMKVLLISLSDTTCSEEILELVESDVIPCTKDSEFVFDFDK